MAGPSRSLLCTGSLSLASCRKSRNEASHRPRRSGALVLIGLGAERRTGWLVKIETPLGIFTTYRCRSRAWTVHFSLSCLTTRYA
jgi:hypothetical protein